MQPLWLLGCGSKSLRLDVEEVTSILAVQTSEKGHDPSGDASRRPSNHVIAVISLSNKTTDKLERVAVVSRLSWLNGPSASRSCEGFKSQTMSSTGTHNTTLSNLVKSNRVTSKRVESLEVDRGPGVHSPFNRITCVDTDAGLGSTDILSSWFWTSLRSFVGGTIAGLALITLNYPLMAVAYFLS